MEAKNNTGLYVTAILVLSAITMSAITLIVIFRPNVDNTSIITVIMGFTIPLVTGLLAAAVHQIALQVNGRLTELLQVTAKASKAEGKLEGNGY